MFRTLDSGWIGLNDRTTEGTWAWASNTVVGYLNWGPGEPNSIVDDDRDCVEMIPGEKHGQAYDGTWNDDLCSMSHNHICEIPNPTGVSCST